MGVRNDMKCFLQKTPKPEKKQNRNGHIRAQGLQLWRCDENVIIQLLTKEKCSRRCRLCSNQSV